MEKKYKIYAAVSILIAFLAGWHLGSNGLARSVSVLAPLPFLEKNRDQAPKDVNWQILWDTIDKINEKYVNRPADMHKILEGAIGGVVASLGDPYSVFLPPKQAEDFKNELSGNFQGIGAEIAIKNQQLTVVTPLDNSPAIKAGIKAGDIIFKIDNGDAAGLTLEEAVNKIRGPARTKVTLTLLHKGQTKVSEISIIRAKIEVKSADSEIKTVNGKKIRYIKLRRFGDDTTAGLNKIITSLLTENIQGIILDLRNNPGGYLDTAVEVASNWIEDGGLVVIQKYGDGQEQAYKAQGPARLARIPTVVLINGGSASAAEIVSGALRDHSLAKLIGEKSFGKGSVQELINLRDRAQLKLTIAKWLTPNDHDLNKDGLEPDIKVELKDEDFQAGRDPQLDRALEEIGK